MARLDTTLGTVTRVDAQAVYVVLDREPGNEYACQSLKLDPALTGATDPDGAGALGSHTHALATRYVKGARVAVTPLDGIADVLLVLGVV